MLHFRVEIMTTSTERTLATEDTYLTHNYHPLPVVAKKAKGAWVTDVEVANILIA